MECVNGARRAAINRTALLARSADYPYVWVDLGTGDGRFVTHLAATLPRWFVIGVDACREPLRERSRKAAPNSLFAIANAHALPPELNGLAHRVSINFPWGSLLSGLVEGNPDLLGGLNRVARPDALLDIRLNGGALHELGLTAADAARHTAACLSAAGWRCAAPVDLNARQIRDLPSSWARKLVHGPHPWAIALRAVRSM
jgi:16S rRNA (adenine(1408)-N(1))-methyltransferase